MPRVRQRPARAPARFYPYPARTIAAKSSPFRLAPPISPLSTSACPNSSAALFGLTTISATTYSANERCSPERYNPTQRYAYSAVQLLRTVTPPVTPPGGTIADAPQSLQAAPGNAQVRLTWEAPLSDGGSEITGYAYRYKESGGDFIVYTDIPESGPGEANARSYTVTELTNGLEYVFHVRALNEHGGGLPEEVTVTLPGIVSSESEELPTEVVLWGNYPNPFNPETVINYALPQTGHVRLAVYDMTGKTVAVLIDGVQPQGRHTVRFHADGLPTGTYVYRLTAGAKTLTRTMTLLR